MQQFEQGFCLVEQAAQRRLLFSHRRICLACGCRLRNCSLPVASLPGRWLAGCGCRGFQILLDEQPDVA
jgi:hypothetical protein